MKSVLEALRRMITLPRRYNSVEDILNDPAGAVRSAKQTINFVWLYASMLQNEPLEEAARRAYDAISRVEQLISK